MVKPLGSSKSGKPLPYRLEKRTITKVLERVVNVVQGLMDRGWAMSKTAR